MPIGIGLICWSIKPDKQDDFIRLWEEELKIDDKDNLIFEYLSEVNQPDGDMFQWDILAEKGVNYINVGFWTDQGHFVSQMQKPRSPEVLAKIREVKAGETIRLWLTPKTSRKGKYQIKPDDLKMID